MEEYEKKNDHAVSEKETDIPKLTDLLLKVGTQQFLETLSPYITGGEILFDGDDGQTWKFTFDPENKSWQQKCGTESFTDQMMIHELEQKGYEIRKKGGTVINKKAGKSCGKRKIVQISNASSELIKATIQEKHMSYRGLAMLGKIYSLITGEEFWKTWEKLDLGAGYEDIICPKNDVPPIKGAEEDIEFYRALGKQNEDELMRYKGDKELKLSDNMKNAIERWKRAYGQVTKKEIKKLEMEKALKKFLEDFFNVWNFRILDTAFVREFLKHKNDDRYKRAMIVLIELIDKETKYFPELTKKEANIWLIREIRDVDEMIEINAYLETLRNHLRRKEILGF